MEEQVLLNLHKKIFDYLMQYKEKEPEFVFQTRIRNNNDRLAQGYLFQGDKDYIFVPLYKVGSINRTKTIGFVVKEEGQYIEIVFHGIKNQTDNDIEFHKELIEFLMKQDNLKLEKKSDTKFWFWFKDKELEKNLNFYITAFRNKAEALLEKYHLKSKYEISEEKFQKNIQNIDTQSDLRMQILKTEKNKSTKNIILYGIPGIGKTHNIKKLINLIESKQSTHEIFLTLQKNEKSDEVLSEELQDRVKFVTFHQSFGYEDFIEGFRPNKDGNIEIQEGIFKRICQEASENPERNHYLVIDEINRGNISKIFGELITLIEEDKRDKLEVTLPYSKEPFKVPSNLYIIGTMNTADKSIALIDVALRRRFTFVKMEPNAELINHTKAKEIFKKLNDFLKDRLDEDRLIGHSYFMGIESDDDLQFVLDYKIEPLLEEYFYGDQEGLEEAKKKCVISSESRSETSNS